MLPRQFRILPNSNSIQESSTGHIYSKCPESGTCGPTGSPGTRLTCGPTGSPGTRVTPQPAGSPGTRVTPQPAGSPGTRVTPPPAGGSPTGSPGTALFTPVNLSPKCFSFNDESYTFTDASNGIYKIGQTFTMPFTYTTIGTNVIQITAGFQINDFVVNAASTTMISMTPPTGLIFNICSPPPAGGSPGTRVTPPPAGGSPTGSPGTALFTPVNLSPKCFSFNDESYTFTDASNGIYKIGQTFTMPFTYTTIGTNVIQITAGFQINDFVVNAASTTMISMTPPTGLIFNICSPPPAGGSPGTAPRPGTSGVTFPQIDLTGKCFTQTGGGGNHYRFVDKTTGFYGSGLNTPNPDEYPFEYRTTASNTIEVYQNISNPSSIINRFTVSDVSIRGSDSITYPACPEIDLTGKCFKHSTFTDIFTFNDRMNGVLSRGDLLPLINFTYRAISQNRIEIILTNQPPFIFEVTNTTISNTSRGTHTLLTNCPPPPGPPLSDLVGNLGNFIRFYNGIQCIGFMFSRGAQQEYVCDYKNNCDGVQINGELFEYDQPTSKIIFSPNELIPGAGRTARFVNSTTVFYNGVNWIRR